MGFGQGNPPCGQLLPSRKRIRAGMPELVWSRPAGVGVHSILPTESRHRIVLPVQSIRGANQAARGHTRNPEVNKKRCLLASSTSTEAESVKTRDSHGVDQVPRLYECLRRSGIRGVATRFRACRSSAEFLEFGITSADLTRSKNRGVGVSAESKGQGRGRLPGDFQRREFVVHESEPPSRERKLTSRIGLRPFGQPVFAARLLLENLLPHLIEAKPCELVPMPADALCSCFLGLGRPWERA